jgi:hypothetical protein
MNKLTYFDRKIYNYVIGQIWWCLFFKPNKSNCTNCIYVCRLLMGGSWQEHSQKIPPSLYHRCPKFVQNLFDCFRSFREYFRRLPKISKISKEDSIFFDHIFNTFYFKHISKSINRSVIIALVRHWRIFKSFPAFWLDVFVKIWDKERSLFTSVLFIFFVSI